MVEDPAGVIHRVLRLPQNDAGRDFVVGDIHFKTIDLFKGLRALGFDSSVDRVIGVGDLIDRGPGVLDGLKLLGEPWFFTVLGNHERMLIDAYNANPFARYAAHGAGWWSIIADESKAMIIDKLESLPTVIEIASTRGIIGVVHADLPAEMPWKSFIDDLANPQIEEIALWGRGRITQHFREGVNGVWRVCTGHTWIPSPLRLGNVIALDCTGGGEGPLGIYCVQDDTIYVEGRSVCSDGANVVTERLAELEKALTDLKTLVNANKLIESQEISRSVDALAREANTAWLSFEERLNEERQFTNALHGLSLLRGESREAKLSELKEKYRGTQLSGLLERLFD
jgi:serine/threonine protein phosphatase 1